MTVLAVLLGAVYGLAIAVAQGMLRWVLVAAPVGQRLGVAAGAYARLAAVLRGSGVLDRTLTGLGRRQEPLALLQTTPAMVNVMLPFVVLPLGSASAGHDPAQLRAARSLGPRPGLVLRRVVLPQAKAGIIGGGVLVFTLSLGFYITPVLIGGPRNFTVGSLIADEFSAATSSGLARRPRSAWCCWWSPSSCTSLPTGCSQ